LGIVNPLVLLLEELNGASIPEIGILWNEPHHDREGESSVKGAEESRACVFGRVHTFGDALPDFDKVITRLRAVRRFPSGGT